LSRRHQQPDLFEMPAWMTVFSFCQAITTRENRSWNFMRSYRALQPHQSNTITDTHVIWAQIFHSPRAYGKLQNPNRMTDLGDDTNTMFERSSQIPDPLFSRMCDIILVVKLIHFHTRYAWPSAEPVEQISGVEIGTLLFPTRAVQHFEILGPIRPRFLSCVAALSESVPNLCSSRITLDSTGTGGYNIRPRWLQRHRQCLESILFVPTINLFQLPVSQQRRTSALDRLF
jgi:hypothetical protein